jgi:hypothetical protein
MTLKQAITIHTVIMKAVVLLTILAHVFSTGVVSAPVGKPEVRYDSA